MSMEVTTRCPNGESNAPRRAGDGVEVYCRTDGLWPGC